MDRLPRQDCRQRLVLRSSEDASRALYQVALDPHGMQQPSAAVWIASILDISMERANQALIELLTTGCLSFRDNCGDVRIVANYEVLQIDDTTRDALLERQQPFVDLKQPHSTPAQKSLEDFFLNSPDTIYIGCEVTGHQAFPHLRKRAEAHYKTVFLIPRKRNLPAARHAHYEEIAADWIKFIKDGDRSLRKHVTIRVTRHPFPQLYTSGLGTDRARFNFYYLDTNTTRFGTLFEVKPGTSLYQLIATDYNKALQASVPHWQLSPFRALGHYTKRLLIPLLLIVAGVILSRLSNPVAIGVSVVLLGVLANLVWSVLGSGWWGPTA